MNMFQDVRYGLRVLRNSPGFTAVAALSLALGIGANTAIFSFVDSVLLKPLRAHEPGRLVSLYQQGAADTSYFTPCSYPEFEYHKANSRSFAAMTAYLRVPVLTRPGGAAESVSGELVSPEYFRVLGLGAAAGRLLGPGDANEAVAVISHGFWQGRLNGDPQAIGRTLRVGTGTFTIVGVAPEDFRGIVMDWDEPPSVWVPVASFRQAVPAMDRYDIMRSWGMQSYLVTARLKPGVTLEEARAEAAVLGARLDRERPDREVRLTATLLPVAQARFWPGRRGSVVTVLGALMAAVGLVLLIACFNIANMMLARASKRRRELAVRLALGAGRGRIVRQLLIESLLVSAMGGAAGLLVAAWVAGFLEQFQQPFGIRLALDPGFDFRVFGFCFAVTVATGIASGLAPAIQASRSSLVTGMKTDGGGHFRLRGALVAAQIAFSVVLVAGAALFVRTLQNARAEHVTAKAQDDIALMTLDFASRGFDETETKRFYPRVLESVRTVPGVRSAALVWIVPWRGRRGGTDVSAANHPEMQVDFNAVSSGYFNIAGVPLVRGRDFDARDVRGAVINEMFAREFFPGADPIGKQFRRGAPSGNAGDAYEVVGVVRDGKFRNFRDEKRPGFYIPIAGRAFGDATLEMRTAGPAAPVLGAVRARIRELDRDLPVSEGQTLRVFLDSALSQERLLASLAAGMGALALMLAAAGIYGVVAFAVEQRTREIGIRMALGATAGAVRGMVMRDVALVLAGGLAVGIAGALAVTRLISTLLFGVRATDPAAYLATAALLCAAAIAAAYIPARRAAHVDPMIALRCE
ncbi:MAG: ABC transporter permease [Acidobacteriota bacterium]